MPEWTYDHGWGGVGIMYRVLGKVPHVLRDICAAASTPILILLFFTIFLWASLFFSLPLPLALSLSLSLFLSISLSLCLSNLQRIRR